MTMGSRCYIESDDYYVQQMHAILREYPHTRPPMHPAKLLDHVYIGNQGNADNIALLQRLGITHVLNCAGIRRYDFTRSPYPPESGIKGFLMISALDHESFNIARHFDEAISFLDRVKKVRGRALVHCNLGVNRSGAIVAAYLMIDQQQTLLQVTNYLKLKRFVVLTNKGFRLQLVQFARSRGLLDPVIDTADVVPDSADRWSLVNFDAAASNQNSSTKLLRSLKLFDSLSSQVDRRESKSRGCLPDKNSDQLITNGGDCSTKKFPTLPRMSKSPLSWQGPPSEHKVKTSLCLPVSRDSLPVVKITPSSESKAETDGKDYAGDKSDVKSHLKPSTLTPVYEQISGDLTPSSKLSGFLMLLGSKRKPVRSTSYSNVSSSSQSSAHLSDVEGTVETGTSHEEHPEAPLSTSRPLRIYTRSSTDSELYKTKSRHDKH